MLKGKTFLMDETDPFEVSDSLTSTIESLPKRRNIRKRPLKRANMDLFPFDEISDPNNNTIQISEDETLVTRITDYLDSHLAIVQEDFLRTFKVLINESLSFEPLVDEFLSDIRNECSSIFHIPEKPPNIPPPILDHFDLPKLPKISNAQNERPSLKTLTLECQNSMLHFQNSISDSYKQFSDEKKELLAIPKPNDLAKSKLKSYMIQAIQLESIESEQNHRHMTIERDLKTLQAKREELQEKQFKAIIDTSPSIYEELYALIEDLNTAIGEFDPNQIKQFRSEVQSSITDLSIQIHNLNYRYQSVIPRIEQPDVAQVQVPPQTPSSISGVRQRIEEMQRQRRDAMKELEELMYHNDFL